MKDMNDYSSQRLTDALLGESPDDLIRRGDAQETLDNHIKEAIEIMDLAGDQDTSDLLKSIDLDIFKAINSIPAVLDQAARIAELEREVSYLKCGIAEVLEARIVELEAVILQYLKSDSFTECQIVDEVAREVLAKLKEPT